MVWPKSDHIKRLKLYLTDKYFLGFENLDKTICGFSCFLDNPSRKKPALTLFNVSLCICIDYLNNIQKRYEKTQDFGSLHQFTFFWCWPYWQDSRKRLTSSYKKYLVVADNFRKCLGNWFECITDLDKFNSEGCIGRISQIMIENENLFHKWP